MSSSSRLRMTGLISGMDTESIISSLVSVKRAKVTTAEGEQTKLSWKQDIWKDLNKQLKSLQSQASTMQFTSAFSKKTTAVSDSSKASVISSDDAVNSVQELEITTLAKTCYFTGGTVTSDNSATSLTTLGTLGFSGEGTFKIDGTDKTISVNSESTISDVLTQLKDAGLNASFDAKNQRLFISAKTSGSAGQFDLVATNEDGKDALAKLGLASKSDIEDETNPTQEQKDATVAERLAKSLESYKTSTEKLSELNDSITKLKSDLGISDTDDVDQLKKDADDKLAEYQKELEELSEDDFDTTEAYEAKKKELEENVDTAQKRVDSLDTLISDQTEVEELKNTISTLESYFKDGTLTQNEDGTYTAEASETLINKVEEDYAARAEEAQKKLDDEEAQYVTKTAGTDAEIKLNGATFKSSTNVFEINGLTITALDTTDDAPVTLTTQGDTTGVFDMIKSFIKSYNTIINKMDTLYNADSASGYSMLTDEEKEELSDSELEKYETKIKDSLLRSDSTISTISSALTSIMSDGITVNGKTMYLSDFGINTLSYFSAAENERHAYHIDGDEDDENTSGETNTLKSMIASDPDTVISFFTQLSQNLYDKMSGLSTSVSGYRSYGSFYNDKKMSSDYSDYTSKISELEEKLNDYEDKLYSQYSAMETALAKLQSSSSSVTSLLGS